MKLAFVISSLGPGGAERVASILCNQWAAQGHQVDLITWEVPGQSSHYDLLEAVNVHQLDQLKPSSNLLSFAWNNLGRVYCLRKKLRECDPDVVISFMTNTNITAVLASRLLEIPCIISERIHPGQHHLGGFLNLMRRKTYPLADAVVVQTSDIAKWCDENLRLASVVIANPIELDQFNGSVKDESEGRKKMIAVGRLEPQKGFDLLIAAMAGQAQADDWSLHIYGQGSQEEALSDLIKAGGAETFIKLEGVRSDIFSVLSECDLYVHCARYEGFPNALMEALAAGCCVIATDTPGGAREILQDGAFGFLCQPEDLTQTLSRAMGDGDQRQIYRKKARHAVEKYDAPLIAQRWIDLAEKIFSSKLASK